MDFIVPKKDLLRLVSRCQGVADKKSAMPALSNVLLSADTGLLSVSATDLYLSITGSCSAEVVTPGGVALPARELFDRVKAMPEGPVQLTTTVGGQTTLRALSSPRRFTIHGIPSSDFPPLPKPDAEAPTLSLPTELMAKLISRTHFSVSTDETRPQINSALFEWSGDRVRMVTTDGHRLSKMEAVVEGVNATATMLIPRKAIVELKRLADDAKAEKNQSTLVISQSGPNAFFELAGMRFGVKLVDTQFPNYRQLLPKTTQRSVLIPRKAFAEALDAVRIAASDRNGGVKITTTQGLVRITSESPESGNGFDEIPVDFQGTDLTIGFNARYLLDVLGALDDDAILLGISGELDPTTLRPATETPLEDFIGLVMPMRV